jgi:hypothetical protein
MGKRNRSGKRLSAQDRQAVDLIMDSASTGSNSQNDRVNYAPSIGVSRERIEVVGQLLRTLDYLPAEEPPANLAARTIEAVFAADPKNEILPLAHITERLMTDSRDSA